MPVDPTLLTSSYDNVDRTSYTTASISPTGNRWLVADLVGRGTAVSTAPTVTGLSLTWTTEAERRHTTALNALVMRAYARTGATPGSGALTFNYGVVTATGCAWVVYELGADTDSTDPFVQSVTAEGNSTTASVTLAAYGSADNRPLICAHVQRNTSAAQEAGYTEIGEVAGGTPDLDFAAAYHASATDTSPSYTFTLGDNWLAIASEIKAGGAPPPAAVPTRTLIGVGT